MTAVAAKKKERSELRGELKKRQSKYEKEYAENSQKLIDLIQGSGTVHVQCALHVCPASWRSCASQHRSQAQET